MPESAPDAQPPSAPPVTAPSNSAPELNGATTTDGAEGTAAAVPKGVPAPGADAVKDEHPTATDAKSPGNSKIALQDSKSASGALSDSNTTVPRPTDVPVRHRNQIVTFSSRRIDNVSDIMDALNISTSASIQYGTIKGSGSASYVNENKVSESDLNYIVTVKVTNEMESTSPIMKYNPIPDLRPQDFASVFGDCFIAGFLEGGEFSAIISLKVGSNADVKSVQLAAEVQLQTGVPGLTVAAKSQFDKGNSDVWKDVEVTISVNWIGGGEIKTPEAHWTMAEVMRAANAFPAQVSKFSQRTSAILMSYDSVRSFQIEQVKLGDKKMTVLDYALCEPYTSDLWSAYQGFKLLWKDISNIMTKPYAYQPLDHLVDGEPPILTDPLSLNDARLQCRKGMTQIVEEAKILITNPSLAAVDSTGRMKAPPYKYPAILRARLPRYTGAPPSTQDDNLWKSSKNWSPEDMAAIVKYTSDRDHLSFSPLVGELVKDRPGTAFCTLDFNDTKDLDRIIGIAIHAHKHYHMDAFLHPSRHTLADEFAHFSKHSQGAIAGIGFTTFRDKNAKTTPSSFSAAAIAATPRSTTCPCHCTSHVGRPTSNLCMEPPYISHYGDTSSGITRVDIAYSPSPGAGNCMIGALKLTDSAGMVVLDWDMYRDCAEWDREEREVGRAKLVVKTVYPPRDEEDGEADDVGAGGGVGGRKRPKWVLGGFWGSVGEVVVGRLGVVWRRV